MPDPNFGKITDELLARGYATLHLAAGTNLTPVPNLD